ncbi:MAG: hypothetical protein ACTS73_05410 [Arsenophonus sp. NEOnobi-MAG3]
MKGHDLSASSINKLKQEWLEKSTGNGGCRLHDLRNMRYVYFLSDSIDTVLSGNLITFAC